MGLTPEERKLLSEETLDDLLPFGQNGHWGSKEHASWKINFNKFLDEFQNLQNEPKLIGIKVNKNYLPSFLEKIQARTLPASQGKSGYMSLLYGVPLYLDESVDTYELMIEPNKV